MCWLRLAIVCVCPFVLTLQQVGCLLGGFRATREGGGAWNHADQGESPHSSFCRRKTPDKWFPAGGQPPSPAPRGLNVGLQSRGGVVNKTGHFLT